ncbi:hypothetical protein_gp186 [Bacillus phage vB_BceM_WH1]|nr:hypothetical protein_gp186 [Bacillus phage vB_BceM_WH1]
MTAEERANLKEGDVLIHNKTKEEFTVVDWPTGQLIFVDDDAHGIYTKDLKLENYTVKRKEG